MSLRKKNIKILFLLTVLVFLYSSVSYAEGEEPAEEQEKHRIMVSMGDSYSSGEGVEPFYGQGQELEVKVKDEDWLAHRSKNSWPGMLCLPGDEGTMADNKGTFWFFVAASGAKTENYSGTQKREVKRLFYHESYYLPAQLDIFDKLEPGSVDYVTMTIGGNDVGFADIIRTCATEFEFINPGTLSDKLENLWAGFDAEGGTADKLIDAYTGVSEKAGSQAHIIVAGYPKLLSQSMVLVSADEADLINGNVTKFNEAISEIVSKCADEGMNICFVPVEAAFEGHEAYSDDPYLNGIIIFSKDEDLLRKVGSDYSMHPNLTGQTVYAACVQEKINEIEETEAEGRGTSDSGETDKDKLSDKITDSIDMDAFYKAVEAIGQGDYDSASQYWNEGTENLIGFYKNLNVRDYFSGFSRKNSFSDFNLKNTLGNLKDTIGNFNLQDIFGGE